MTYEYECKACGHEWEAEQKITEPPLLECPKCKAAEAKRVIGSAPGVLFVGRGWFKSGGY